MPPASAPTCQWSANFVESYNTGATPLTATSTNSGSFTFNVPYNPTTTATSGTIYVNNQKATVSVAQTNQQFADVPVTAYYFDAVNLLKQQNITAGCSATDFCPTDTVTRAEMAIFIVRGIFTDVPTTEFAFQWIQRLKQDNITSGCSATTFCPDSNIIRGDMAVFIERALFNQLLPANEPILDSVSSCQAVIRLRSPRSG